MKLEEIQALIDKPRKGPKARGQFRDECRILMPLLLDVARAAHALVHPTGPAPADNPLKGAWDLAFALKALSDAKV